MRPSRKDKAQESKLSEFKLDQSYAPTASQAIAAIKSEHWFVGFARKAGAMFTAKNEWPDEKTRLAVDFLGWKLEPKEVNTAPTLAMLVGFMVCLPLLALVFYLTYITGDFETTYLFYALPLLLLIPIVAAYQIKSYPVTEAKNKTMEAITFIPEIVNYLVMSMKLSPNLENAIKFAAEHGRGNIAEDFRKLAWNVELGKYRSIEEGLDELAYKWGSYSEDFKHALMIIRSCVIEVDEGKRNALLDKAVTDTLEGISESMGNYAVQMRQPSIYLYYVGVLLPLLLIIMLPIGSAMAGLALSDKWLLILLYNILIPIGTIFFAMNILSKRPPVYMPPQIPDDYPGLPKKGHFMLGKTEFPAIFAAIIVFAAIFLVSAYILEPLINPVPPIYNKSATASYFEFFHLFGLFFGATCGVSVYLYSMASAKRKVQLRIIKMEKEFKDSIYLLASRLGENRPIEEAVAYSGEFLKGTEVSGFFKHTADNIQNMGMTIESALFDPAYGSMKYIPSEMMRGSMRVVVDSIKLGVQQAARALISLSLQLRDSERLQTKIRSLLEEITAMMKSIAFMIAPLVLGITTALQKIIINALKSACGTASSGDTASQGVTTISLCAKPEMLATIPTPYIFMLIMAFYVVEVTAILIYFTSRIEEGDNRLSMMMNIATTLPIAVVFFFASAWFAGSFSGMIG